MVCFEGIRDGLRGRVMRVESWTVSKSGLKSEERVFLVEGILDVKILGRYWVNFKG